MQAMAIPLSNFITKFGAVLAITLWDRDIFCRYCVMSCSFRMVKFRKTCLVSSKNILCRKHLWNVSRPYNSY